MQNSQIERHRGRRYIALSVMKDANGNKLAGEAKVLYRYFLNLMSNENVRVNFRFSHRSS